MWSTNVTIGDLHYLRSKFAQSLGLEGVHLPSFLQATESFYYSKQFAVNGEYFLTWAFLTPEMEVNYLSGGMDWLPNMSNGVPWIMEAHMPNKALSAFKRLRYLIPKNIIRFKRGENRIGRIVFGGDLTA